MRYCVCLFLVAAALTPAAAAEFPFEGYVAADSAEIASGPGRRFYVTGKVPRGTKVEVYREDDAGWLAIRPPEGSFSWLPAEHVEEIDDGVGKVRSAAECWIGTTIEQVPQHKSQVSLKAGELIEIIDRKQVKTADGKEEWLKIAPPAGEFRFIHSRDVSREPVVVEIPEPEVAAESSAEPASADDQATEEPRHFRPSESAIALRDIDEVRSKLAAMREDLAGLAGPRAEKRRLPRPSAPNAIGDVELAQYKSSVESDRPLSPDGFVPRRRRESESLAATPATSQARTRAPLEPLPRVAQSRPLATAASPASSMPASLNTTGSFAERLEKLDLELSLMLAQDKSTWNLAEIRQRVEQLVASGPTPAERGQARLLLDKIKQFEETFDVSGYGPLAAAANGEEAAAGSPYAPRYDAKGWLKPVISRAKPAAPYAVVDADGKPLCFVTPSPGLNLGRYANKEVGLYGTRGYIEALKTPHLVAERVIDLGRHAEQVSSLPVR
jgi:hypothetical protein